MFAERRAYLRLRRACSTALATRYASAMVLTREYATQTADPELARKMRRFYDLLKEHPTGRRIRTFGKKRKTA